MVGFLLKLLCLFAEHSTKRKKLLCLRSFLAMLKKCRSIRGLVCQLSHMEKEALEGILSLSFCLGGIRIAPLFLKEIE